MEPQARATESGRLDLPEFGYTCASEAFDTPHRLLRLLVSTASNWL